MNKGLKERDPDPLVQAHRRSLRVFMKILNFWKSNETLSEMVEQWNSYMPMQNILREQVSMMETWKNS